MIIRSMEAEMAHELTRKIPRDPWEAANLIIKIHGLDAPAYATRRARRHLRFGKIERRKHWMRIMVASKALLARELFTS